MQAPRSVTELLNMVQPIINNHPLFIHQLNEYINERDILRQRLDDYKNNLNQYETMDKRTKEARTLKAQINEESENYNKDRQELFNKIVKLYNDFNEHIKKQSMINDIKNKAESYKLRREAKQQQKRNSNPFYMTLEMKQLNKKSDEIYSMKFNNKPKNMRNH